VDHDWRVPDPPNHDEGDGGASEAPLSRVERVRAAIGQARERVEAKRETSTTVSVAYDAFGRDIEAGGPVLAAALGFRVFLFFVPYVGFLLLVFGYLADIFDRAPDEIFHGGGIAAITANGIQTNHDWSAGARISALVLVGYALFLGARSFVKVLRIVHTLVWRSPPSRLRHPTRATFVFIGVVTVALALSALIDVLLNRVVIGGIAALVLYTGLGFAVWWLVSWWLPHGDCDLLGLVPGAALFAIGVEALHVMTVVWFPHAMKSKSELYGTIGLALALLFWAYLLGRLMAVAAALNFALWRRRTESSPPPPAFMVRVPLLGDWLGRRWTVLTRRAGEPPVDPPD
jgi:uncharacterized BrkB/YihY/UPF0761 family membrane protein